MPHQTYLVNILLIEILLWARKSKKSQLSFNYELMKYWNNPKDKLKNRIEVLNRIISSSSNEGLDPFVGSGTTGIVCSLINRKFIGIDNNKEYLDLAIKRFRNKNKNKLLFFPKESENITRYI